MVINRKMLGYVGILCMVSLISLTVVINPMISIAIAASMLLMGLSVLTSTDMVKNILIGALAISVSLNLFNYVFGLGILVLLILISFTLNLRTENFLKSKSFLFFVFWLLYAAMQMMWVITSDRTISYLQSLVLGVVTIWILMRLCSNRIDMLYKMWGMATLLSIIVGWWEVLTENHLPRSGATFYKLQNVATAGFYNPNDFCFYLLISMPVIFQWMRNNFMYKLMGVFVLISSFYFMNLAHSRFIMILFAVSFFVYTIMLARNNKRLLGFIILVITACVYRYYDVITSAISDVLTLGDADNSTNIRRSLYMAAWSLFKQHPSGVGSGNVEYYMPQTGLLVNNIVNAHNFWLENLVNYGAVVFVGLAIFFVSTLRIMVRAMKSEDIKKTVAPALGSILLFIPACIESSSIFQYNVTWFMFGLMICVTQYIKRKEPA